jgi:hypothetical protein
VEWDRKTFFFLSFVLLFDPKAEYVSMWYPGVLRAADIPLYNNALFRYLTMDLHCFISRSRQDSDR